MGDHAGILGAECFLFTFLGQNRAQRRCDGHALRQCTAPSPGFMALQTENTVGLPLTRKERICGQIVINVLISLAQRRCGGHALRQCTAPSPGSMALQTENTVGLPLARKERICGHFVINVLIFFGALLVFQGPIQALQNAPPYSKMKKKKNKPANRG